MEGTKSQSHGGWGAAAGLLVSCAVTACLLLLLALLLLKRQLDEETLRGGIIFIYILSAFLGGLVTGKRNGSRKFLWGLLTGCLYFVLLLALSWMDTAGGLSPGKVFTTFAMCAGGGTLGGMLA